MEDDGWTTVTYKKKSNRIQKKHEEVKEHQQQGEEEEKQGGVSDDRNEVFGSIEVGVEVEKGVEDSGEVSGEKNFFTDGVENGGKMEKKIKAKKPKKAKVTLSDAAAKIDSSHLAAFLDDVSASYETQQDIQLMRFADYFGHALSKVSGSKFPWMKTLKESSVAIMVDPVSNIPDDVLKTSTYWLNKKSSDALASFVTWSLDSIVSDMELHQGAAKNNKKVVQQTPAKSKVGIFVVLAMVLRHKPDVLIHLLPTMKDDAKHHGQEKLPLIVWVITQACHGDMVLGLFMVVHVLFPMISNEPNGKPLCRDFMLQVIERIISMPKARSILVNGALKISERLVPPSVFEILMRFTFPSDSARVEVTERFEAIYPIMKEVALAASPGIKALMQLTQEIMPFAIKFTGEGDPGLAREGTDLVIWCLTKNHACYFQWDDLYLENVKASMLILKKLSYEWKVLSSEHSTLEPLKVVLKNFIAKNEKELANEGDAERLATLKDAQKHCKILLSQVSCSNGCLKVCLLLTVAVAVSATCLAYNLKSLDM